MQFTAQTLRKVFPHAKQEYLDALVSHIPSLERAGILANDKRIRHFLAQGAAETGGLVITEESGAYTAQGLLKVFPKYFKSVAEARIYAKRPQAIFDRTYGGRLGNNQPGDGYKYRGRGMFQITGKDAYRFYGEKVGLDLVNHPEQAAEPQNSIPLAIAYWTDVGLNPWADKDDILAISRGINGGNPRRNIQPNGMNNRRAWYAQVTKLLVLDASAPAPEPVKREVGTLREGDEGSEVERLQSKLRAKGYSPGNIDGVFGANTRRAVETFQADNGSEQEAGVWQPEYWPILENAPNVQEARKDVTASDLHTSGDPAVTSLTWSQRLLSWLGLGALVTGGASSSANNFPDLVTQYQPVIEVFRPMVQWAASNGWLLVGLAAFVLWLLLRRTIAHIVEAYRHGDYQGAFKKVE